MAAKFDPTQISRPHPRLMRYYLIVALLTGPLFPIVILPLYFKYETLRYRFDGDGISMSWGILFRREIYLTYRRIQDIHLTRGLIQRWMGLATVSVQTASGSAMPEMSIDGLLEADALRDFLYSKMRGSHADAGPADPHPGLVGQTAHDAPHDARAGGSSGLPASDDEVLSLLREIRDGLRKLAGQRGAS